MFDKGGKSTAIVDQQNHESLKILCTSCFFTGLVTISNINMTDFTVFQYPQHQLS